MLRNTRSVRIESDCRRVGLEVAEAGLGPDRTARWAWFKNRVLVWYTGRNGVCEKAFVWVHQTGPFADGRLETCSTKWVYRHYENQYRVNSARAAIRKLFGMGMMTFAVRKQPQDEPWRLTVKVRAGLGPGHPVDPPEGELRLFHAQNWRKEHEEKCLFVRGPDWLDMAWNLLECRGDHMAAALDMLQERAYHPQVFDGAFAPEE